MNKNSVFTGSKQILQWHYFGHNKLRGLEVWTSPTLAWMVDSNR